ncbi:hypothetical protein, partial [Candidatus Deferrimicrobium sp.]|uniref:hypothetical protein n=1 Tax=Candidatus Deferrimicrobium sp. TaxID=3060586 RepID=UPI003C52941F
IKPFRTMGFDRTNSTHFIKDPLPGPGCAASEGGAPFVARRALNLHGCAPFFLRRGYPRECR